MGLFTSLFFMLFHFLHTLDIINGAGRIFQSLPRGLPLIISFSFLNRGCYTYIYALEIRGAFSIAFQTLGVYFYDELHRSFA